MLAVVIQQAIPDAQEAADPHLITLGGWVLMVVSVAFVTGLMIWCFKRVLSLPSED